MTDPSQDEQAETPAASSEVLLDLTFVPVWARTPPAGPRAVPPEGPGKRKKEERRTPRRPLDRPPPHRPVQPAETPDIALAPVSIELLPERRGVAPLAHRLACAGRAFSLFEVAAMFLSKPEYYAVRLAVRPPGPADAAAPQTSLYQCAVCQAVFLDRPRAAAHVFVRHFDQWYLKEEQEIEEPKGNFVCVARCGLSGELLGPPNYHGFNDRILEMHRLRFSHLSLEEYRQHIENVHDPALIQRWKETMRRQTSYRLLDAGERWVKFADVEKHFQEQIAPGVIRDGAEFMISGAVASQLDDRRLESAVRRAWQEEWRFPLKMSVPLRLAFRRLGLHLFKTAGGNTFVTSILPRPIDPAQAVPLVRAILEYLTAHPGCRRAEMQAELRVGDAVPQGDDVSRQLHWLVARGHVIEFADGRMAAPVSAVSRIQHARPAVRRHHKKRRRPPQERG